VKKDGTLHPTDQVPINPDTVGTLIGSSVGAIVTADYPSGAHIVTFAGTAGFWLNARSTAATVPTSNSSGTTSSSGLNEFVPTSVTRQIGDSTGFSIAFPSSGLAVSASYWAK